MMHQWDGVTGNSVPSNTTVGVYVLRKLL